MATSTRRLNGFALASILLSTVGMIAPFAPLLGIVFGVVALTRPEIKSGAERGRTLALIGILFPIVMVVLTFVLVVSL